MKKKAISGGRRAYILTMRILMGAAAIITAALVLFLIAYVLIKGLPNVSWTLLSTAPSYLSDRIGILPDILNTLYIVIATLLIVLPLGVGAAIYLTEYATNRRLIGAIEYAAETLSGIPSIIYGLVGMLFFCQFLNMKTSLLAGALTLVIMNLPTIMRTTQESLKTVPQSYREGAFGLGAGKWRVIRTVVLPGCVDGVITGCILSVGRILGESAALLFTAGFAHALAVEPEVLLMDEPTSALDPISTSKIEELAMQLKEQYTIVIVTHNMQQAVRISDRTAFFLLGELVECGDTQQLFSQPQDKRTEDYITGRFG